MDPTIFLASPEEMEKACSQEDVPHSVDVNRRFIAEITDCFGSEESAEALKHGAIFNPLMANRQSGTLTTILTNLASKQKPELHPDTKLKVLLKAGNLWLSSGSANHDVQGLSADIRNQVFLVGSYIPDSSRDLLRGDTFIPTDNVDKLCTVLGTFLTFVYKMAPDTIQTNIKQIEQIYNSIPDDTSENKREQAAAEKIVDTNIIPGLLTSILLQHPTTANGSNLVGDFVAGATVKINADKVVSLRNPNEISRGANSYSM